jgi:hypothetical protein
MRFLLLVLPVWAAFAQDDAPTGLLHGDLLTWSGAARSGEVVFRNTDNRVYQCAFDDKTYVERSGSRTDVPGMQPGDRVEVLTDRRERGGLCYARTIHVIDAQPVRALPVSRPRSRVIPYTAGDLFLPRGDLTIAGIVVRLKPTELTLRTRTNERKIVLLRPDTRYLTEGQSLDRQSLNLQTRVFIRAGRNLDNEIEAYQIVWGDALAP